MNIKNTIERLRNLESEAQNGSVACADVEEICCEAADLLEKLQSKA